MVKPLQKNIRTAGSTFPQDELRQRIGEIPADKDLVLICNTGVRSYEAQLNLRDMGMTDPVSVQGGIVTLNKCGLDL